jgi:hypothetical protein
MTDPSVFLVCAEDKDVYCLSPLLPELQERFGDVTLIPNIKDELLTPDGGALLRLTRSRFPVIISASVSVFTYLSHFRSRESYIAIGIEHGIAPFKGYTYAAHFHNYDAYMSPTELWHDRLVHLYPSYASKFWLGGYPRLSQLADIVRGGEMTHPEDISLKWINSPAGRRKLVIFSWGVEPNELGRLPDREDVVYLLHPASASLTETVRFEKATCVVSRPALTAFLISNADIVLGDFSSMTLEAAAIGKPVYMFLDRSLYSSDCDLGEDFFCRSSPSFGLIPKTNISLPCEEMGTLEELKSIIIDGTLEGLNGEVCITYGSTNGDSIVTKKPLALDSSILPPATTDNRALCAGHIAEFLAGIKAKGWLPPSDVNAEAKMELARFLAHSYKSILGRDIDKVGLSHYMSSASESSASIPVIAVQILHELALSKEGRERFSSGTWNWPHIGDLRKNDDLAKSSC